MLKKIIQFSIQNRLIVLLGLFALLVGGVYSISKLPIDAVPDITNNQVMIITSAPSAGAPDIERLITVPIEQATRNIPGIIEQRSFSRFGLSLVTIVFEDKLTCIGFYSDRKDYRFKGISYFELDPITLAIRKSKYNPFTEQFIIDKYGKSKDKELKNLSFRGIMITQQNEIVFNAEEYYMTSQYQMMPNGGGYWTYTYHYDDIVSAKIATDGNIIWARNINKRQATSGDDSYISYTSTIKGNDTYFFINTGEKVKKLSNDRIQFGQTSTKKSNLNVIRITPDGNFDFQEILDDKDSEVPFMVSDGAISKNSVYFIGRKGKKKQILKVTL